MSAVVGVHDFIPGEDGLFSTLIPDPFYRDPKIYDAITSYRTEDRHFYLARAVVGEKKNVAVNDLHLRCLYPRELEALLHYNGFEMLERLGGFDGTPFSSDAPMQIVTCRLRA